MHDFQSNLSREMSGQGSQGLKAFTIIGKYSLSGSATAASRARPADEDIHGFSDLSQCRVARWKLGKGPTCVSGLQPEKEKTRNYYTGFVPWFSCNFYRFCTKLTGVGPLYSSVNCQNFFFETLTGPASMRFVNRTVHPTFSRLKEEK